MITDPQALANAVVSGQADIANFLDPTTIELVESRQSTVSVGGTIVGFSIIDKTGAANPAFASEQARLAIGYAIDRETLVDDLHPGSRPTSQFFPEAATGFDPAIDEEYAYDPDNAEQLLAEAGLPDGFEFQTTVLGQPSEDQVVIQSQLAEVGHHHELRDRDVDRPALRLGEHRPGHLQPLRGGRAAGRLRGRRHVRRLHEPAQAKEPEIEAALGGALGGTGDAQEQALTDLNRALTRTAGSLRPTRTSPTSVTTPTRWRSRPSPERTTTSSSRPSRSRTDARRPVAAERPAATGPWPARETRR